MTVMKDILIFVWQLIGVLVGLRIAIALIVVPVFRNGGRKHDTE